MIRSSLSEVANWCGGQLHGDSRALLGASSDTRTLGADALFVAVRGERVDGHDCLAAASSAGAAGALVERLQPHALAQIVVADSTLALGRIASHWLQRCPALRIGLTGSNGKTTVKTLTHAILAAVHVPCYANPGNRNNELGLPLAALEVGAQHRCAIFEMGAGKPGDIEYLCGIARPQIALVNNVAAAHLERLLDLDGVARTKGAIYSALPEDGVAVINTDDAYAPQFRALAGSRRILSYGLDQPAQVSARRLRPDADGCSFELLIDGSAHPLRIGLVGRHNVLNALAAATLALAAGADPASIVQGLEQAQPVAGRLRRQQRADGVVILDDSYNANPGSFAAGIQTLGEGTPHGWVAMGDMAELGEGGPALHAQIGALARQHGIERLYAVGPLSRAAVDAAGAIGRHFSSIEALNQALAAELQPGVTLLVKGSRSAGMERVVAFLNRDAGAPASTGVRSC